MLGTVGVAPAGGEVRSSLVPDRFGGNMDTPQMRAGSTVFLGVNVEGAMFSIGDGHYRQGEGEACGTAVEGAMTTTLIVELIKGGAPGWPRIEDDTHWMTVGSSRPMEDSWRIGTPSSCTGSRELYGLHPMDAYQLCSQIAQVPVANVVDANYSVVVKAAKALLPAAERLRRHPRRLVPRPALGSLEPPTSRKACPMDLQLSGKRVLVTGGTRGIGRAIVEAFLDEGAVGRLLRPQRRRGHGHSGGAAGPRPAVTGTSVDVGDGDALAAWVEQSAEAFGGLDVVVANVSALAIPDTEENWQASLNVDLMHTVRLVRAAMPHLERSDAASIIAISSVSGRESDFASGPYGTAKTAIVGYIHGLALQLADKGIRANTVSPGNTYFEGGVWANIETGNPDLFETAVGLNPTGHMGTPEEIAGPVVFLASPRAAPGQRHQPRGRRRADPRHPALTSASRTGARPNAGLQQPRSSRRSRRPSAQARGSIPEGCRAPRGPRRGSKHDPRARRRPRVIGSASAHHALPAEGVRVGAENRLQVEDVVADVEGEQTTGAQSSGVHLHGLLRQQVHRDRVGAEGVQDDQVRTRLGHRLKPQPPVSGHHRDLRRRVGEVGEQAADHVRRSPRPG